MDKCRIAILGLGVSSLCTYRQEASEKVYANSISSTIMGGCLYLCSEAFWTGVFSDQGIRIIFLLLLVSIGFILFVGIAILSYGLKISELREVFSMSNKSGN